jgi:glycosyltransferase involved in cell wall biosynthesis
VAVLTQSGRSDNLINPLQSTDMTVAVDPANPHDRDIVIVETPDRGMAFEVLQKPFHDAKLVFRMRGNPWFGIDEWIDSRLKTWLAKNVVMPGVDGCVTITPSHARLFEHKTGVKSTVAQVPVYPDEWPASEHTDTELRIITLTNCMYLPKINPLIKAFPVVNTVLNEVGGYWRIGGDGNYEDKLARAVKPYNRIAYPGYLQATDEMKRANLMLHLSNLDGMPNAVLEGMASQLPVITNDHHAFMDKDRPNVVVRSDAELREQLLGFTTPEKRTVVGEHGRRYVRRDHNDEAIGQQYVTYFKKLLSREHFEQLHGVPHPEEIVSDDS